MTWTCEQVETRLSEYVDRLLAADERKLFEEHADGCARCAPLVAQVSTLVERMHGFEPVGVPLGLERRILEAMLGPAAQKKPRWAGRLAWLAPVASPRFAYGAVTVLITLAVLSQTLGFERPKKWSDLHPVNVYRAVERRGQLAYARGAKFFSDLRVVYEIQSRLGAAPEQPAPQPERKPDPGGQSSRPEDRKLNRANEERNAIILASLVSAMPAGSVQ